MYAADLEISFFGLNISLLHVIHFVDCVHFVYSM